MKYLLALGLLGMANAQTYQLVDSGHCEDQGYQSLTSIDECQEAATAAQVAYGYDLGVTTTDGGCYLHPDGKYYFNTNTNNFECSNTNEYLPCVCLVPPATECTNPSSAAAYIDAQCCDCP